MKKLLLALMIILPTLAAAEPRVFTATFMQTIARADSSVDPPVGGVAIDGDSIILTTLYDAWLFRRGSDGAWSRSGSLWHVDSNPDYYLQVAMKSSIAVVKLAEIARIWEKVGGQWVPSPTAAPIKGQGFAISAQRIMAGGDGCDADAYFYEKNSAGAWGLVGRAPPSGTCPAENLSFDLNYDTAVLSNDRGVTRTYHRNGSAFDWVRTGDIPAPSFPALQNDTIVIQDLSYYRRSGTAWNLAGKLRPLDYAYGAGNYGGIPVYRDSTVLMADSANEWDDTWEPYVYMKNAQGGFNHVGIVPRGLHMETFDISGNTLVAIGREFQGETYTSVNVFQLPVNRFRPPAIANNFDAHDVSGFTPSAGSQYSLVGSSSNYLYRQSNALADTSSVLANSDWTDYQSVEAELRPTAFSRADSWVGLAVRYVDADNYYFVSFGRDQTLRLQRKLNGVVTTLIQYSYPVSAGTWQKVKLVADAAGVRVEGLPGIYPAASDTKLTHGRVAVLTSGARADFDNLVARSTSGFKVFNEQPRYVMGGRDYTFVGGHWTVQRSGDAGIKQDDTSGQALAVYGPTMEDQAVRSLVRLDGFGSTNPVAWYGVVARYVDPNNYYYLSLRSSGTLQIRKVVNGVITVLKSTDYTLPPGEKHWVQLNIIGNELTALIDDAPVARAIDGQIARGRPALGTYRATATFDTFTADQP